MDTFDPDKPCRVHDGLNDQMIEWSPQWASINANTRRNGTKASLPGMACCSTDGLSSSILAATERPHAEPANPCGLHRHQFARGAADGGSEEEDRAWTQTGPSPMRRERWISSHG